MAIAKHKTRRRELRDGRALARRVQRGDRRAFELLYASYEGRLYRFCHRLTGSDAAAASLVEATFVRGVATLPEEGLDALDVPRTSSATARTLAYERHTNGGAPWLDPIPGEHAARGRRREPAPLARAAHDARAARSRGAPRRRDRAHARRRRRDGRRRSWARARLRLRDGAASCPRAADGCDDRLAELSAYADGTLPADAPRRARDARRGLRGAAARRSSRCGRPRCATARCPVPVPPGELSVAHDGHARRRRLSRRGARARSCRIRRPPRPAGRMSRRRGDGGARDRRRRHHVRRLAQRRGSRCAGARSGAVASASPAPSRTANAACTPVVTPRRMPAARLRGMTPRSARLLSSATCAPAPQRPSCGRAASAATRPGTASSVASPPALQRRRPGARRRRRAARSRRRAEPACRPGRRSRRSVEDIPVQILPPVAPPHTPATARRAAAAPGATAARGSAGARSDDEHVESLLRTRFAESRRAE